MGVAEFEQCDVQVCDAATPYREYKSLLFSMSLFDSLGSVSVRSLCVTFNNKHDSSIKGTVNLASCHYSTDLHGKVRIGCKWDAYTILCLPELKARLHNCLN